MCYGRRDDLRPRFQTWELADGPSLGLRFVSYENELIRAIETFRPRLVLMEAPLIPGRQGSVRVARQQIGLAAYTEGECARAGIQCRERESHVVRKAVIGRGRWGSSEEGKAAVVAWCRSQGWRVSDHHQADAGVLWAYAGLHAA